jgi:hypothetical protein
MHVAERVAEVPDYGDVEELAVVELDALEEDQGGGGGMFVGWEAGREIMTRKVKGSSLWCGAPR